MHKKKIMSKLNSQKGITGADVMIALLIIISAVGVMGMIYVNLVVDSKGVDRKTGATRIATNIIENIDMLYYDQLQDNLDVLVNNGIATKQGSSYTVVGNDGVGIFETSIPKGYKITIDLTNSYGIQAELQHDLVKKVSVKVEYLLDGVAKNVTLSNVIEREVVRECNSPNFTEEYVRQMVSSGTEYQMFSSDSSSVQEDVKIICPIQYDDINGNYKVVEKVDSMWYSYSNKEWARVLVLDASEFSSVIDFSTKVVTDITALTGAKSYVWIPRFGVKNGGNLFGDTLFKYKNTNLGIVSSYENGDDLIYNYLDENVTWGTQGISFESNELLGKWSKYSDLATTGTDAYILNNSQYGPRVEH